jgi:hypothetical protein
MRLGTLEFGLGHWSSFVPDIRFVFWSPDASRQSSAMTRLTTAD